MSDNKKNVGRQDRVRVDANDRSEVEYVHRQFPNMKHEDVLAAVKSKGPYRDDIISYLQGKHGRSSL